MQRANSVSDEVSPINGTESKRVAETLASFSDCLGQKENPADAAAGLSKDSHETSNAFTGKAFFDAFCQIEQARNIVDGVVKTYRRFEEGRPESEIEGWEFTVMLETLPKAEIIYRECYRGSLLNAFEPFFGHTHETFEIGLSELKRIYGGAE